MQQKKAEPDAAAGTGFALLFSLIHFSSRITVVVGVHKKRISFLFQKRGGTNAPLLIMNSKYNYTANRVLCQEAGKFRPKVEIIRSIGYTIL